jgi:hypothetical protein
MLLVVYGFTSLQKQLAIPSAEPGPGNGDNDGSSGGSEDDGDNGNNGDSDGRDHNGEDLGAGTTE